MDFTKLSADIAQLTTVRAGLEALLAAVAQSKSDAVAAAIADAAAKADATAASVAAAAQAALDEQEAGLQTQVAALSADLVANTPAAPAPAPAA